MKAISQLLHEHQLRNTPGRNAVLRLLITRSWALSNADIEHELAPKYDRVTVYRTLKTFLDKGVIHKVLDDGGVLKYALCPEVCATGAHHHDHVHFKCRQCGHTECLDEAVIPPVKLPAGYQADGRNLLVEGLCPLCLRKKAAA